MHPTVMERKKFIRKSNFATFLISKYILNLILYLILLYFIQITLAIETTSYTRNLHQNQTIFLFKCFKKAIVEEEKSP